MLVKAEDLGFSPPSLKSGIQAQARISQMNYFCTKKAEKSASQNAMEFGDVQKKVKNAKKNVASCTGGWCMPGLGI